MLNDTTTVRCLLIPIQGGQLLLPTTVIAEILTFNELEELFDPPNGLLALINWRNQRIPLLSIENILSLPKPSRTTILLKQPRIIILYCLEPTQTTPFYALKAIDVPHTLMVTENTLTDPSANVSPGLVFKVKVKNRETAWLPDLAYLENLLTHITHNII